MRMRLVTVSELISSAPARWWEKHKDDFDALPGQVGWENGEIGRKLLKMAGDRALTRDAINLIIGNESWATLECSHCRDEVEVAARMIGEWDDEEDDPFDLCADCARAALAMMEAKE